MKLNVAVLFLVFAVFLNGSVYADDESLAIVDSRAGVQQKFILIKPTSPTAAVILFAGGHGALELESSSFSGVKIGWGQNNFLVRTRNHFASHGFIVAVVDKPSDRQKMNAIWRMSAEHATDILSIVRQIKKKPMFPYGLWGQAWGPFQLRMLPSG